MAFTKSHLGMCMVTRGHIITIKIFPGMGSRWGHGGSNSLTLSSDAAHNLLQRLSSYAVC